MYMTTEEGDRVVKNFGCVIIVIIKFVDQDIIEFLSCFYIYTCICSLKECIVILKLNKFLFYIVII